MKRNLVLIGMPSCGKTTLGALAAQRLGCPFADMDEAITRRIGMPIAAFFARYGENAFREVETRVAEELSRQQGFVIATGGGVILRRENMEALKGNGLVCHLRRDLCLLVTHDPLRPLSGSRADLERMAQVRLPLYEAYADFSVENNGTPELAAERLAEAYQSREGEPCR